MANVLIVDDEPQIREIVRELLVQNGHRVGEAADGLEAIEKLAHSLFHLIISDFTMPRMGGLGILKYMRKNDLKMPVLILSGSTISGLEDETHLKELGAYSIIHKPIELDELMDQVNDALAHASA